MKADEAISLLQGVIKDQPQLAGAHHYLGVAFLQKRQMAQAQAAFTEAIKVNPSLGEPRTALAQIYLAEGSADLALEQAQAAIQINPSNVQAAIISGDAYLQKGDVTKGSQVFEAVAKAVPNEPIGPYRLGIIAHAEKDHGKALAYFEEALHRRPAAIEPIAHIAAIRTLQGKGKEARERVRKQLETNPNNPFLYHLLGQLWLNAKDLGQAETNFKKAIQVEPTFLQAYMSLGQTYHQSGKVDEAVKEYEAVLSKDPTAIQVHMLLGIIYETRKEHAQARERYEAALKLNPQFAPAANNLAWSLVDQGGNLISRSGTPRQHGNGDQRIPISPTRWDGSTTRRPRICWLSACSKKLRMNYPMNRSSSFTMAWRSTKMAMQPKRRKLSRER